VTISRRGAEIADVLSWPSLQAFGE